VGRLLDAVAGARPRGTRARMNICLDNEGATPL